MTTQAHRLAASTKSSFARVLVRRLARHRDAITVRRAQLHQRLDRVEKLRDGEERRRLWLPLGR